MGKNGQQVLIILGTGSFGGLASWLLLTPDLPSFGWGDFYHLGRSILLGLIAAGVGVYFFPAADIRNFVRCVFFALACGLGNEAVLRGGKSMVEQIGNKDAARKATAALNSLNATLNSKPVDLERAQREVGRVVDVLPTVKDPDVREAALSVLDSALFAFSLSKDSSISNSQIVLQAQALTHARKSSQATSTLETLRLLDAACDQWAIEYGESPGAAPSASVLAGYVKTNSKLYTDLKIGSALDALGNTIALPVVDTVPIVPAATYGVLSDVAPSNFWVPFYSAS